MSQNFFLFCNSICSWCCFPIWQFWHCFALTDRKLGTTRREHVLNWPRFMHRFMHRLIPNKVHFEHRFILHTGTSWTKFHPEYGFMHRFILNTSSSWTQDHPEHGIILNKVSSLTWIQAHIHPEHRFILNTDSSCKQVNPGRREMVWKKT